MGTLQSKDYRAANIFSVMLCSQVRECFSSCRHGRSSQGSFNTFDVGAQFSVYLDDSKFTKLGGHNVASLFVMLIPSYCFLIVRSTRTELGG